jgi:hypothetical protein
MAWRAASILRNPQNSQRFAFDWYIFYMHEN